jgi:amino acid transporter
MKKLTPLGAIGLTVGGMIGSAIFSLSGVTIAQSGGWAIESWALAGLLLAGFGFVYAKYIEHGATLAVSGDGAPAQSDAGRRVLAFLIQWTYLFGCVAGTWFSAVYIGKYVGYLAPGLEPYATAFAVGAIGLAAVLCAVDLKISARVNLILVAVLVAIMVAYCLVVLVHIGGHGVPATADVSVSGGTADDPDGNLLAKAGRLFSSVPVAVLAYGAIVTPAFFRSELGSERSVRKVIAISALVVTALYCVIIFTTNFALSAVGLPEAMMYFPLNYTLSLLGVPSFLSTLLLVAAILALFTTVLVVMQLGVVSLKSLLPARPGLRALPADKDFADAQTNDAPTASVNSGAQPAHPQLPAIVIFALAVVLGIVADTSVGWIINQGALMNTVFIALICGWCVLSRRSSRRSSHCGSSNLMRIAAAVIAIALILCNVKAVLEGGWQLLGVSAIYLAVGGALSYFTLRKRTSLHEA